MECCKRDLNFFFSSSCLLTFSCAIFVILYSSISSYSPAPFACSAPVSSSTRSPHHYCTGFATSVCVHHIRSSGVIYVFLRYYCPFLLCNSLLTIRIFYISVVLSHYFQFICPFRELRQWRLSEPLSLPLCVSPSAEPRQSCMPKQCSLGPRWTRHTSGHMTVAFLSFAAMMGFQMGEMSKLGWLMGWSARDIWADSLYFL
jgi:hypothetical protein